MKIESFLGTLNKLTDLIRVSNLQTVLTQQFIYIGFPCLFNDVV
jgi:hypothetical protein